MFILDLIVTSAGRVWLTFLHNWPFLVISVLLAAALKLFLDPEWTAAFLRRYQKTGVVGATAVAVATPLCSCGTTAVVLGMMANLLPWAPIIAFMAASPLTSPEELVYSAGLFGWPFALTFFGASIFIGLAAGTVAGILDDRGWLANQARLLVQARPAAGKPGLAVHAAVGKSSSISLQPANLEQTASFCCASSSWVEIDAIESTWNVPALSCGNGCGPENLTPAAKSCNSSDLQNPAPRRVTLPVFLEEVLGNGKRLLGMFFGFAFIGYFLNGLIPPAWVTAVFGNGNVFSVPLAATLGLPLYINSEASLPLVRAMMEAGMSQGAALAFLITGSGTSIGAVTGMLAIARWRVISIVVITLWISAVLFGLGYNLLF